MDSLGNGRTVIVDMLIDFFFLLLTSILGEAGLVLLWLALGIHSFRLFYVAFQGPSTVQGYTSVCSYTPNTNSICKISPNQPKSRNVQ